MPAKIIDINWRDCEKTGSYTFFTNMDHVVRVKKHSIPIVFIPGIMGSRLQGAHGAVWDPADTLLMAGNFIINSDAQKHKRLLIDQALWTMTASNTTSEDQDAIAKTLGKDSSLRLDWNWLPMPANGSPAGGAPEERKKKIARLLVEQGWGEIALGFYKKVLFFLASQDFGALHRCFVFPVYACGYNWVHDNDVSGADLSAAITKIIEKESKIQGRECDKVIVVSHSMGGLASRSAMMLHGLKDKCFGAIHGAQPVTGAPAAYKRMRGGAEGWFDPSAYVLGHTSALVTPVLGGCVGGLELLPTQFYRTGKGSAQWLQQTDARHQPIGKQLPLGDPYSEIYKADKGFLRLVLHPELLTPGQQQARQRPGIHSTTPEAQNVEAFYANVDQAKTFHQRLNMQHHPLTAFSYTKNGLATYDQVTYRYQREQRPPHMQYDEFGNELGLRYDTQTEGSGVDLDKSLKPSTYFEIDAARGTGDGTVPESSGRALSSSFRPSPTVLGIEHGAFYDNSTVQSFTASCIAQLAEHYRKQEVGK